VKPSVILELARAKSISLEVAKASCYAFPGGQ